MAQAQTKNKNTAPPDLNLSPRRLGGDAPHAGYDKDGKLIYVHLPSLIKPRALVSVLALPNSSFHATL